MRPVVSQDSIGADMVRFGIIANDIPADTQLPLSLEGWQLDWAKGDEQVETSKLLRTFAAPHVMSPHQEMTLRPDAAGGVNYAPASAHDWRYCVIRPLTGDA